jgi:hypothetical protein
VKYLLAKKQAPKGWQYFTVHAITHHPETASGYDGKVAAEMIGAKFEDSDRWAWNPLRDHVAVSKARPEMSLIALVCAGYEKTIAKDSWRSASERHADYLRQLVAWVHRLRDRADHHRQRQGKDHRSRINDPCRAVEIPPGKAPTTTSWPGTSRKWGGPPPGQDLISTHLRRTAAQRDTTPRTNPPTRNNDDPEPVAAPPTIQLR